MLVTIFAWYHEPLFWAFAIGTNALAAVSFIAFAVPFTILIGNRDGGVFKFPEPRFFDEEKNNLLGPFERYRTAWDAIGGIPAPQDPRETLVQGRWADLLPTIPEGSNYLHHTDRGGGFSIFGWRRRYWSFLLKLSKRRPAWTLTAQPGPAIGPFHWKNRRLSRLEMLRLQTFPAGYEVSGSVQDAQRQLRNAVPSLLAEVLALEIRRQLLDHRVSSRSPTLLPPLRRRTPAPEPVREVPEKFLHLIGQHDAHPGTGLGYGALRRAAD